MTNKEQIQKEIEQTLQSLDGVQRATANPFLFTRIKARMQKPASGWERVYTFIARPVVAIAVVVLVMAVNGWSFFGDTNTTTETTAENTEQTLPEFENEYQLITSTDNYDFENVNNQ
jgi:Mn2+/Fe2+ NRAMP family transporter